MAQELRHALPTSYELEEYEIEAVLGHGDYRPEQFSRLGEYSQPLGRAEVTGYGDDNLL